MYIGDIGFFNYDAISKKAEIGYRLIREQWSKGIMAKAIAKLAEYGFRENGHNRIEAFVDSRNEASRKVLIKNGFPLEGRLRQYEFENDEYIDVDVYSLLNSD